MLEDIAKCPLRGISGSVTTSVVQRPNYCKVIEFDHPWCPLQVGGPALGHHRGCNAASEDVQCRWAADGTAACTWSIAVSSDLRWQPLDRTVQGGWPHWDNSFGRCDRRPSADQAQVLWRARQTYSTRRIVISFCFATGLTSSTNSAQSVCHSIYLCVCLSVCLSVSVFSPYAYLAIWLADCLIQKMPSFCPLDISKLNFQTIWHTASIYRGITNQEKNRLVLNGRLPSGA